MTNRLLQWIEIERAALVHNISQFRRLVGEKRKFLATVKANAYGHGIVEVSEVVLEAGADWLGVHSLDEGLLLRKRGIESPILVLGYVPLDGLEEAVKNDLRLTIYHAESINALAQTLPHLQQQARLHVKVETGTHRQGIKSEKVIPFLKRVKELPGMIVEGLSSHFANIEDTTDHSYARFQLENFQKICQQVEKAGFVVPLKHIACTAAAILFPETYFDMVRIGIGLYGLWPSRETYLSCILKNREPVGLKPALSWKARIAQVKEVPKGAYIGYGCTFRTTRLTQLAVIPVGYYDGYSRGFSNVSHVLIKGHRAPVRGRVAMDFIMVDVTDIPDVHVEDEVVLLGSDGEESISADNLAVLLGTINYEIVTRINPRVPRIVI